MKNLKFKWLLLSIILSIASINTALAVTYNPSGVAQQTMQSQQVMQTGGAYNGTVYEPFSNATPSEASNPAKAPGGPRRGYNPETGEWTPDAPDIETAGDYGQSGESPIGEPWVMALFALAFAGVIAIRQYKRKTIKSMNMKNSTSKFIATLALLCALGVGQMWGYSWTNGVYIYFDNGTVNWSNVYLTVIDGSGTVKQNIPMTHLGNTSFWYTTQGYNDYGSLVFRPNTSNWDKQSNNYYNGVGSNVVFTLGGDKGYNAEPHWDGEIVRKGTSGSKVYFWNNAYTSGTYSTVNFRYGMSYWSLAPAMKREPGTQACYAYTLASDIAYYAYEIANKPGWTGGNSIYQPADFNKWGAGQDNQYDTNKITGETTSEKTDISGDVYITPTGTGSTWGGFCQYYNYSTSSSSGCSVSFSPSHGTITVEQYLNDDGSSTETISSGTAVLPTRKIRISTTPDTGYKLSGTIGVTNATNISAGVYYVTGASVVSATFVAKQSILTFVQEGDGYASGGQSTTKTATYGSAMPTTISVPTAATGYKFQGYYDGENGTGTKYYNADGTSAKNWDKDTEDGTTLYAYFEKSQLTEFTFSPTTAAGETSVTITPTITPTPTGTTYICWGFYSDSECTREVAGVTFTPDPSSGSGSVSFTTPAASGVYYVKGVYRTGNDCSASESAADVLNVHVQSYIVASDHTVTVRYMCDGVAIHAPSEYVVPAGGTLAITALEDDDVFGYTFDSWALGDGINQESVAGGTITISAFFNGVLTANYTKKNIIYFKNTLRWENVYVNLYTQDYWDSGTKGSGNSNNTYTRNVLMSQVPGTTDIFYYEYTNITTYVSFTSSSQNGSDNFWGSGDGVNVVYPTRPDATSTNDVNCGFSAGAPMFVPVTGQTGQVRNEGNKGKANYFDKGYWRKYEPATGKTGYYLEVYNKPENSSRELLYSIDMTDASTAGDIFEATIDLEAGKNYGIKVLRDNDFGYTNISASQMALVESGTYTELSKQSASNWRAVDMQSTTAGNYTFKLTCGSDNGKLKIAVKKPAAANDYRVVYRDANHNTDRKQRFSRTITKKANADDIVSFFIDKDNSESMKFQYISNIVGSTVTWADAGSINLSAFSDVITQDGVYNFYVHQDGSGNISVTKVEPYTGDFYIRTDAVGGTKWADYQNAAHVMAYSEYAKDNSGYSHYWMKHLIGTDNVNVKFVVANDYSAWVSDTVILQSPEVAHIDADGKNTGDVSIRFSYNSATNEAKRTYLANSTASDFLVLKNNATSGNFTDENDVDKAGMDIKFVDHENYIYDIIAKVNPSAKVRIKVYAHYKATDQPLIGTDVSSTFTDANSKLLLNGTGSTLQTIRILYDFKTNRIVSAWQAAGTTTGKLEIDADLMIVREHQGAAQNIILEPYVEKDKPDVPGEIVTNKRIYAVMRFNRWILNNLDHPEDKEADHAHTDNYTTYHPALEPRYQLPIYERNLYYISFPFDVNVSDIFGFGTYGTHYAIQRYDGIGRAKNGYWVDSDPNWKWVPPTGKLNAYEGYVLSLSLSNMYVTNTNVWANNCSEVELYFPSAKEGFTIDTKDVTIEAINGKDSEYRCTIDRGTPDGDRRIKDSYWRCIGVPSFANYETALTSDGSTTINWQPASKDENDEGTIPFIYNINWNDKSLTAYEGSTFPFKAMHSYLVQYGGGIHWSNVVVSSPASVVARKRNENTSEHTYCLKLMQGDTFGDQTFVRMTDKEGVTSGFDFDQDLWKQKFANRANIYTFIGYEQVAGNSMPMSEQTTVVPVGVQIAADGEYTFVMPEGTEGVGVVLIDNIAGTRTNLALTDYTVNLAAGQYDGRFFLEISPIVQSPTGIEQTGSDSKDGVRKVMVDGILYIVKDGRIYDATGNRVQ